MAKGYKNMNEAWADYKRSVIDTVATGDEAKDAFAARNAELAFYGGGLASFEIMTQPFASVKEGLQQIQGLHAELQSFAKSVFEKEATGTDARQIIRQLLDELIERRTKRKAAKGDDGKEDNDGKEGDVQVLSINELIEKLFATAS